MFAKPFQKAFSLIELMVVIGIIGIISAVSLASLSAIQKSSRDAQRQSDLRVIQGALQQYYADQNSYPDLATLNAGASIDNCTGKTGCTVTKTYLSASPKEPTSNLVTPYCYISLISSASGAASCASATPGKCHFYELYTKLENSSGTLSCGGNATYNLKLTPL